MPSCSRRVGTLLAQPPPTFSRSGAAGSYPFPEHDGVLPGITRRLVQAKAPVVGLTAREILNGGR